MSHTLSRPATLAIAFALCVAASSASFGAGSPTPASPWQDKVDSWVLDRTAGGAPAEFLVFLAEQADLSAASRLPTKLAKGRYVYETLTAMAERTQEPIRQELRSRGVEYRPFWVANMIWVHGDLGVVQALAMRPDVMHLYANPLVHLDEPSASSLGPESADQPAGVEWNIAKVKAPEVWAAGYSGQGIVVGGQDTGYQWDHPALQGQYRGWDGANASHDYSWHDAIHSGGIAACPADSPVPCDDYGHGTHTMGIMVGDDGAGNQIGVAPGAKWIGCRNMDQGNGTPATYTECYQWFIAPTTIAGAAADPSKAPDVINNSWGCTQSEGCAFYSDILLTVVQNVRAAGIVTVHSAGNSGSACSTIWNPAAIYAESFTVGSTDSGDVIAANSSRGPVTIAGGVLRKPDISAPGVGVRSSYTGSGYRSMSGTSMAGPHVAGAVALLISAYPALAGDVDAIEFALTRSAVPLTYSSVYMCGADTSSSVPNNVYGWGRLDALAAYTAGPPKRMIYLPLIVRNYPPMPLLDAISNTDGDGSYTVSWSAVTGATAYALQEDDDAAFSSPTTAYSGASTSWNAVDKPVGTYYYRVNATGSWGTGPWSNIASTVVQNNGINGRVTYQGAAAAGVGLRLWFYNGSAWSTAATTTTNGDGRYGFTGAASLANGQQYRVSYGPNSADSAYVSAWWAPSITTYTSGSAIPGGDFDIANVFLLSPASGAAMQLPVTFTWQRRGIATDTYGLVLFDPNGTDRWVTPDLGNVGSVTPTGLPDGAVLDYPYGWYIMVYNGADSYGESYYYQTITFLSGVAGASDMLPESPLREGPMWSGLPARQP